METTRRGLGDNEGLWDRRGRDGGRVVQPDQCAGTTDTWRPRTETCPKDAHAGGSDNRGFIQPPGRVNLLHLPTHCGAGCDPWRPWRPCGVLQPRSNLGAVRVPCLAYAQITNQQISTATTGTNHRANNLPRDRRVRSLSPRDPDGRMAGWSDVTATGKPDSGGLGFARHIRGSRHRTAVKTSLVPRVPSV